MKYQDPPQDQVRTLIDLWSQRQYQLVLEEATRLLRQFPDSGFLYNCLGATFTGLKQFDSAIDSYKQVLKLRPDIAEAQFNLAHALYNKGELDAAIDGLNRALKIKPNYVVALCFLGDALQKKGDLEAAIDSYKHALEIEPDIAEAHNNMGHALYNKGDLEAAIDSYETAIKLKPNFADAFWHLYGTANDMKEAEKWLELCLAIDQEHERAKITHAGLRYWNGDTSDFDDLIQSNLKDHPYVRSFSWVFSLPARPSLYFNRWAFFDAVIEKSRKDRPFYEYGVWRGYAFRYLIRSFKKGFGFDTFSGLPEAWHSNKAGTYSSDGNIPRIEGGEFIVGEFEETLPVFFSAPRPMASIINFDADLYSSTICALNHSRPIIDRHTILVFDELIINKFWEQDEFRALNEFCSENDYTYEVLAVSFFTAQVAVRLVGN